MKGVQFSIILILFLFSACTKETIDFNSGTFFEIEQVVQSKNCKTSCGEEAECEGEMVMLRGRLDPSNIFKDEKRFFLRDTENMNQLMEVHVEETINEDVFDKLQGRGGSIFRIIGELEGFDAAMNFSCERRFTLFLNASQNLYLE